MIKALYEGNGHTREELLDFQRRAFKGAWMPEADKPHYLALLNAYAAANR